MLRVLAAYLCRHPGPGGGRPPRLLRAAAALAVLALVIAAQPRAQGGVSANAKQAAARAAFRAAAVLGEPLAAARRTAAGPRYASDHIVVKFEREATVREIRELARQAGGTRVERPASADFHIVRLAADLNPLEAAARLTGEPGVVYAEPDPIVRPLYRPDDPLYRYQWNLPKIQAEAAWDINRGGSSKTVVAVLDTGVAYKSSGIFAQAPDLAGTRFVDGYDFIWNDTEPLDSDGHGTHVTGTIAQTTNNGVGLAGLAFNVGVMPVKVLTSDWDERNHAPNESTMSLLAQGIRWAADHGAHVINMSLGGDDPSSAVESALRYAVGKGAFVAIAAGNSGDTTNAAEWPASYATAIEGVMAVAAVDYNLARAPYSTHRDYVEIAAPGGNLEVDLNNDTYADGILQQTFDPAYSERDIFNRFAYMFFEGTSMATPHVAALAALLHDQGITSPAAIEAAIKQTAANKPSGGRNDDIGYGVIDARAALRGLGLAK
jgi:serine protease